MRTPTIIVLLLCAAMSPSLVTAEPAAAQPLAAVAVLAGADAALVTWVPGAELADTYRIYGKLGETIELVAEVPGGATSFATIVDGGYDGYAVSAVVGSSETSTTNATWGGPYCVRLDFSTVPPGVRLTPCSGSEVICTDAVSGGPCRLIGAIHIEGLP